MNRPDVHLLAALDAGLLDHDHAAEVRAAALADPAAAAVLDALAATRAELAGLADPPVPPGYAARWAAAIDTTVDLDPASALSGTRPAGATPVGPHSTVSEGPTTTDPPGPPPMGRGGGPPAGGRAERTARPRSAGRPAVPRSDRSGPGRSRTWRPRPAAVAAALLLVVLIGALLLRPRPPSITGVELAGAGLSSLGVGETGGLADPVRRAGCLRAVGAPGVDPASPLLGGRTVELDGRAGVLLVLGTGRLGRFDVVVVDPDCGPAGGTLVGSVRAGR